MLYSRNSMFNVIGLAQSKAHNESASAAYVHDGLCNSKVLISHRTAVSTTNQVPFLCLAQIWMVQSLRFCTSSRSVSVLGILPLVPP
jgi:hypothetical protein